MASSTRHLRLDRKEWVVGRLPLPVYVAGDDPYRPDALVIASDDGLLALHALPAAGISAEMVRAHLRATMRKPGFGAPRRPTRIRVAAPELRDAIAGLEGTEVVLDATPEIDALGDSLFEFLQGGQGRRGGADAEGPTYLGGEALAADRMAMFFASASRLWRAAPWDIAPSDAGLLGIDVPTLGLAGLCLSIIGQAGESFGVLVFESFAAQRRFMADVPSDARAARRGFGCRVLAIGFEVASDLPEAMVREADQHGWELPEAEMYPSLLLLDADGVPRPATAEDLSLAIAIAGAVARFFEANTSWRATHARPVTVRCLVDEAGAGTEVVITAPCPDPSRSASETWSATPRAATALEGVRATTDVAVQRLSGELWPREMLRRFPEQVTRAHQLVVDAAGGAFEDPLAEIGSLATLWPSFWLELPDGRSPADAARSWPKLRAPVLAAALARMGAARGIYGEVLAVDARARTITLRDLHDGAIYRVLPPTVSVRKLTRWTRCLTYILPLGDGTWYVPSNFVASPLLAKLAPGELLADVREALDALGLPTTGLATATPQLELARWAGIVHIVMRKRIDALEQDAAREAARPRFVVTSDGERFEPHEATVRVDAPALRKLQTALRAATDFAEDERGSFSWIDDRRTEVMPEGEAIGSVDATTRVVRIQAAAPGRWQRLLARLGAMLGAPLDVGAVDRMQPWKLRSGVAEHETAGVERVIIASGVVPRSAGSPAIAVRTMMLDGIRNQLDREIPMLEGKPRELVRDEAGRAAVSAWLREAELRGVPGEGEVFLDLDPVRAELGLERVGLAGLGRS